MNVTELPVQVGLEPEVMAILIEGFTTGFTIMVIPDEVTVEGLAQVALEVILHVITSPFASVDEVKVEDVSPDIAVPFLFHWKEGEAPPFPGVAVNVIAFPAQVGFEPEVMAMLTEGVTDGVTVMVIPEEVTVEGLAHASLEVILQVITSPSASVDVIKVEPVAPDIFVPFLLH